MSYTTLDPLTATTDSFRKRHKLNCKITLLRPPEIVTPPQNCFS